jgi:hypothetical protein
MNLWDPLVELVRLFRPVSVAFAATGEQTGRKRGFLQQRCF